MFRVMARKNDVECQLDELAIDDRTEVTTDHIKRPLDEFILSAQALQKTLQKLATVLGCTRRDFLNEYRRNIAKAPEGRPQLRQRHTHTRAMVKSL